VYIVVSLVFVIITGANVHGYLTSLRFLVLVTKYLVKVLTSHHMLLLLSIAHVARKRGIILVLGSIPV
jgi:hypothetical protein